MLSKLRKSFNDFVFYLEKIYNKIDHLLKMASTPVLTDIEIGFLADNIEIYPFPIPDLFIHAPLIVACQYSNSSLNIKKKPPKNVIIKGFDPNQQQMEIIANVIDTPHL